MFRRIQHYKKFVRGRVIYRKSRIKLFSDSNYVIVELGFPNRKSSDLAQELLDQFYKDLVWDFVKIQDEYLTFSLKIYSILRDLNLNAIDYKVELYDDREDMPLSSIETIEVGSDVAYFLCFRLLRDQYNGYYKINGTIGNQHIGPTLVYDSPTMSIRKVGQSRQIMSDVSNVGDGDDMTDVEKEQKNIEMKKELKKALSITAYVVEKFSQLAFFDN